MSEKLPKEKRIETILQAALEVFVEKGFDVSMDEIAVSAGMSKGGLYHHFQNKDAILLATAIQLAHSHDDLIAEVARADRIQEGLKDFIKSYLELWLAKEKEFQFFMIALGKAVRAKQMTEAFQVHHNECIQACGELYRLGVEKGEFVPMDTYASATLLLSALDGLHIYMAVNPDIKHETMLDMLYKMHVDVFLAK